MSYSLSASLQPLKAALQQEEDFRLSLAMELPALESELNDIEQNIVESNTRRFNTPSLDDDFITAVVKLGGISIEDASSEGLDRADNPSENVGKYRLFKKTAEHSMKWARF